MLVSSTESTWGDAAALQSWPWFSTLVGIWGRRGFEKITGVTRRCLVITPPPGCWGFRAICAVNNISEVYRVSPSPKKWAFSSVFTEVFLVLSAVSRTARCDAYHASLPSTGDFIWSSPRATWLWQHTQSKKKVKKRWKKGGECGDAENRTPDVRFEVYLAIVFANAKSSLYSLSDKYLDNLASVVAQGPWVGFKKKKYIYIYVVRE